MVTALAVPGVARAQLVSGQVVDSVTGSAVVEAFVSLEQLNGIEAAHTYTDVRGVFLLRAPRPGSYRLVAMSDGFRRSSFPWFELTSEEMLSYVLLLPLDAGEAEAPDSVTRAIAMEQCGDRPDGQPAIVGVVTDRESGLPVANATVYFSTPPSDRQVTLVDATGTVSTDVDGTFGVCNVPPMFRVALHAQANGGVSEFSAVLFGTGGAFADDAFHPLTSAVWRQDLELQSSEHLSTSVTGAVVDTAGNPLSGVLVEVFGSPYQTQTDRAGRFTFSGLSWGDIRLSARRVGYSPTEFDVELLPNDTVQLDEGALTLTPFPLRLREIVVSADPLRANPRLDGFFDRRDNSPRGKFVTETEWQDRLHLDVTDITTRLRYALERSHICSQPESYYLDGVYIFLPPGIPINDFVDPSYLAAVEAYGHGFDAPARYRRQGCGSVILLWSR